MDRKAPRRIEGSTDSLDHLLAGRLTPRPERGTENLGPPMLGNKNTASRRRDGGSPPEAGFPEGTHGGSGLRQGKAAEGKHGPRGPRNKTIRLAPGFSLRTSRITCGASEVPASR